MSAWIEWKGGPMPVSPTTKIEIKYRDFKTKVGYADHQYKWDHKNDGDDIIAYRVIEDRETFSSKGKDASGVLCDLGRSKSEQVLCDKCDHTLKNHVGFDNLCPTTPSIPVATVTASVPIDIAEHPLFQVFVDAIRQAMYGKGERHGGAVTPFLEQQWVAIAKSHGVGFLTGQAAKKLNEAAYKTLDGSYEFEPFEREVLGAIVYSGMALLRARGEV